MKNFITTILISLGLISAPVQVPITSPTLFDYQQQIQVLQQRVNELSDQLNLFGATTQRAETVAFFETALQASISDIATSFTLLAITDKAGSNLASST